MTVECMCGGVRYQVSNDCLYFFIFRNRSVLEAL